MHRVSIALIALTLVFTATAASCPRPGERSARPALRLASAKPFRVDGAHFQAGEHVAVSLHAKASAVRHVQADGKGTFTAVFGPVLHDHCSGLFVRAIGNRGSRALLKTPLPMCLPARTS